MTMGGFDSFLEGAAALFVIYWLMASGCSFIAETISSIANTRGNALRQFAIDMVQGELTAGKGFWQRFNIWPGPSGVYANAMSKRIDLTNNAVANFTRSLFDHNLMKSLEQPKWARSSLNSAPAYVPSTIFAQTVLDRLLSFEPFGNLVQPSGPLAAGTVAPGTVASLVEQMKAACIALDELAGNIDISHYPNSYELVVALLTDYVTPTPATDGAAAMRSRGASLVAALDQAIVATNASLGPSAQATALAAAFFGGPSGPLATRPVRMAPTVHNIVAALSRIDIPAELKQGLQPLIDAAQHDFDELTNNIAVWYDASMARATGWYKRYSMFVLGILGFCLAAAFNVDSPRIIQALISMPELRSAGYAAATEVVQKPDEISRDTVPQQAALIRAVDALCGTAPTGPESPATCEHATRAGARRLLPLTTVAGANAQFLINLEIERLTKDKRQFAQSVAELCKTPGACSDALNVQLQDAKAKRAAAEQTEGAANPAEGADAEKAKDAANEAMDADTSVKTAVLADTRIFWNPSIAVCLYGPSDPKSNCATAILNSRSTADASAGTLSNFTQGIPGVGWLWNADASGPWSAGHWFTALLGWLMTAVMVSFGAPFWFDLLQQIVNRRGAGPKPDEAKASPVK